MSSQLIDHSGLGECGENDVRSAFVASADFLAVRE